MGNNSIRFPTMINPLLCSESLQELITVTKTMN